MIYTLFVLMILQDGTRVDHAYPDQMKYHECMTFARQEAEAMKQEDTSWAKSIDFYCGIEEQFKAAYPVDKEQKRERAK